MFFICSCCAFGLLPWYCSIYLSGIIAVYKKISSSGSFSPGSYFMATLPIRILSQSNLLKVLTDKLCSVSEILRKHNAVPSAPGGSYAYTTKLGTKNILPVAGAVHQPFVGYGESGSNRDVFSRNNK